MSHILVVEDEAIIRTALKRLLERHQYQVKEAGSVSETEQYDLNTFDLIISDLRLPGDPGTEMIKRAPDTPVLIMTSYASLRSAVDSMKLGAVDYIAKPFDHDEMVETVQRIIAARSQRQQAQASASAAPASAKPAAAAKPPTVPGDGHDMGIIGSCESMQTLFKRISKVAPTDSTVLIQGESGTGKELVARAMHERSQRAKAPLISVNCAAIPETLIESELFGHEKGSFTGATAGRTGLVEAADGGTLFLDEIGELPLEAQARLLRVLQEGEIRRVGSVQSHRVDVRLVAATHRDLKTMARQGLFREDLFYRLNVIELRLPPLRDRGADVLLIAEALLERAANNVSQQGLHFSDDARHAILNYTWPGNVRELENAIERSAILCDHDEITADLLGIELDAEYERASEAASALQNMQHNDHPGQEPAEDLSLEDYFQHFVLEHQEHMTETQLAHKLGISRKCLWERRQRLGIPRKKTANS
ncbi:MAG: sigma-54 dependent transcriptional regulator [Halopseudomonas sp.]|uniref:sigma-54-dependent transcriptional regulator n=1 Tax=Halopseudomonas sp. TaxID=2901191 RepID=UPI00300242EC